jgi:uncharacterized membrane protein
VELFKEGGIEMLARYGHIISGITWIGLLYYFNFAQTPAFAQFEAPARNEAFAKLVPRAMWWFRWAAMSTLVFGVLLFGLYTSGDNKPYDPMSGINVVAILTGILFAVIMFSNVWFVIWPAQRRAIANAKNVLGGGEADAGLPPLMRRAATASRTNTFLSIPMLFWMVGAAHLVLNNPSHWKDTGGHRALWYLIVLVVAIVAEGIALMAPPVGSGLTKHLDDHKVTIAGGFILTAVLYLLFEAVF